MRQSKKQRIELHRIKILEAGAHEREEHTCGADNCVVCNGLFFVDRESLTRRVHAGYLCETCWNLIMGKG